MISFEELLRGYITQASVHWQEVLTDFFPMSEIVENEEMLKFSHLNYRIDGGYDAAERARLYITQQEYDLTREDMQLSVMSFKGNTKFIQYNHRDCLGALMGLGFERKCIGDIVVRENGFDVITNTTINDFLQMSELNIKRVPMKKSIVDFSQWQAPIQQVQQTTVSVQQLRIDALIAKVYNLSRANTVELVKLGRVKVNQRVLDNPSKVCVSNEIVSVHGFGKFRVDDVAGINRKGKLRVVISKYI